MPNVVRSLVLVVSMAIASTAAQASNYLAGSATVDVTPDFPVRLSGYGSRREECTQVQQRLFVKALALQYKAHEAALAAVLSICVGGASVILPI